MSSFSTLTFPELLSRAEQRAAAVSRDKRFFPLRLITATAAAAFFARREKYVRDFDRLSAPANPRDAVALESLMPTAKKKTRCWPGYEAVKGKKPHEEGSCRPKSESKLTAGEKTFRKKRRKQLDDWQANHPHTRKSAAQHLGPPKGEKRSG
jgi:hypothetical protein